MSNLNEAIQLIRNGQKLGARRILQGLIDTEPNNIQAWFWYVETCTTTERRVEVLEECLQKNPGNQQVSKALSMMQSQLPKPDSQETAYPQSNTDPFYSSAAEEPQTNPYSEQNTDPYSAFSSYSSYESAPETKASSSSQKQPWEMDPSEYEDNSMLSRSNSKSKPAARSYSFFDVWMTVLTVQDVKAFEDVLDDPEAGFERAFSWMAVAGLVNALVAPLFIMFNSSQFSQILNDPDFRSLLGYRQLTSTTLMIMVAMFMLVAAPIGNMLNIAITGGIQNLMAMLFGGGGNYRRTVYALASYLAPMTMITSLLAVIPVAGQCLSLPVGIYGLVLNVRALRASHSISTGAAIGAIFAPGILFFIFGCLIFFVLGGANLSS
ncbi:MAG: YIP1 family protein [Anaerolineales bacterium]|nr:YIP1 family protein [Anaerolineales bacterium]